MGSLPTSPKGKGTCSILLFWQHPISRNQLSTIPNLSSLKQWPFIKIIILLLLWYCAGQSSLIWTDSCLLMVIRSAGSGYFQIVSLTGEEVGLGDDNSVTLMLITQTSSNILYDKWDPKTEGEESARLCRPRLGTCLKLLSPHSNAHNKSQGQSRVRT